MVVLAKNLSETASGFILNGATFPNKLMRAATLDRLRDGAYRIVLDGETRRKPRPMPQPGTLLPPASATPRSKRPPPLDGATAAKPWGAAPDPAPRREAAAGDDKTIPGNCR